MPEFRDRKQGKNIISNTGNDYFWRIGWKSELKLMTNLQ